ncbi:MAG TPA: tRNA preQ1(34) S-adenosylmethionine ribosyltransferase-isomerase QueA [Verrucomicrobiae bacterium]|nr:tRNA preQ1(34) S-adenosylmethionine ribosyltransferase-isomerase QueA [Verrucomicrobiae bacterium]
MNQPGPMQTADFDFHLPPELIAQHPAPRRDESRLLVLHRRPFRLEHRRFPDLLEFLHSGDVLVLNDSRVIPARLCGVNARTGGRFDLLLLEENARNDWWALLRPGKRARPGTVIQIQNPKTKARALSAIVREKNDEGHVRLGFESATDIKTLLDEIGQVPLPPYIERTESDDAREDRERYQTVFARVAGSVAAPTAGLHFTPELLEAIRARGVEVCFVTLHVGAGTFAPVKSKSLEKHKMHQEWFEISETTACRVNHARQTGRRVVAVGTTTVRALETVAARTGTVQKTIEKTGLFIYPPFSFRVVDALLTNFHLPRSTLLMLVSAFATPGETNGRETILSAYAEAIRRRYRFFSYGDAMLIL